MDSSSEANQVARISGKTSADEDNLSDSNEAPLDTEEVGKVLKKLGIDETTKFMQNFDPERSNRERRKLRRKIYTEKRQHLYDERGILVQHGQDLCDCLDVQCPGCHFPCSKCSSPKCGHECRCNRKWIVEQIDIEGTNHIIKNPYK